MRPMLLFGLLLATLISALSAPVRPRPDKSKSTTTAAAKGPRRPANRGEALEAKANTKGRKTRTNVRRVVERRMVHGHWVRVSRIVRVQTVPIVPPHPDADRLREIQKALADKGFFKGEVNGVWNTDSVDALKQFQAKQNLTPDGKINALSLIGLGLGPKHDSSVAALPPEKPQTDVPQ